MKRMFIVAVSALGFMAVSCGRLSVERAEALNQAPILMPDYAGVTVPATIAPLNFTLCDSFDVVDVVVSGAKGEPIHVQGTSVPCLPMDDWHVLLSENQGDSLSLQIHVQRSGKWFAFNPVPIYVSADSIDESVCYRLIAPGYEVYSKMGIYRRTLSDFNQTALVENTLVPGMCVNCHSFKQTNPAYFTMHVRGKNGATLVESPDHGMKAYSTKTDSTISSCVYPYWHPSGKYIAYSNNETRQTFHTMATKRIEVFDFKSDICVYNIATNELLSSPLLRTANYETFPCFSVDGKRLFFCVASEKSMPNELEEVRYNLCAIDFDAASGTFGSKIDTLFQADKLGKSVSFPRVSYDGRFLMFTMANYGQFSIWHKEADLYLLDLETLAVRPLDEVNSSDTESYHAWSSNSRWVVFSSRRMDGLYTRIYIAHVDESGKMGKPFLLPQEKPIEYYDALIYSYNIPEFCNGTVQMDLRNLENQLLSSEKPSFKYKK